MTGWAPKRFWATATIDKVAGGGYAILLDTRPVRTPAKAPLVLPTRTLALAVAAEWQAQDRVIDPRTMPFTRSANAAIDKVTTQFDEVVDLVAAYGESDLLCYRAVRPERLAARQQAAWQPLLDWAASRHAAPLVVTQGVAPVVQPTESVARLKAAVQALDPFRLTALHDLVGISGSLVIGLAAGENAFAAEQLWAWSRIDEDWQAELWGQDDEATEAALRKRSDFLHAHEFWQLSCDA